MNELQTVPGGSLIANFTAGFTFTEQVHGTVQYLSSHSQSVFTLKSIMKPDWFLHPNTPPAPAALTPSH